MTDYTSLDSGEVAHECGDDASKWAAALAQYAKETGGAPVDEGWLIGWFANAIEQATMVRRARELEASELSASEAVYGFAAWLTTRRESVTLSAAHNANIAAELVDEFCKVNKLTQPRAGWHLLLKHPED